MARTRDTTTFWYDLACGWQDDAAPWSEAQKRARVIFLTRCGLTRDDIWESLGFTPAFIEETVRDFAKLCAMELPGDAEKNYHIILKKVEGKKSNGK